VWFNSFSFLWFFPTVLLGYYAIPSWRARKLFLLASSYIFYAFWNPPFVLLLIGSSVFDYLVGRGLAAESDPVRRKLLVAASCVSNFGVLVAFKYSGLFVSTWQALALRAGLAVPAMPSWIEHVILPVGISFYIFHGVSYIIDVYRHRIEAERSLTDFMLFVAFFPQLVAGPILRASYFVPQLESRRTNNRRDWLSGSYLIILGFFQKVALADNLAPLANFVYDQPANFNTGEVWLGTYAFAFQIYFDFAGYSNIAIGCARLLGFSIPENFRMPYMAAGFREFWRRWHISLSTWLRDYLYVSLGGSRRGTRLTIRNLFIVMALGGLWHGANWTFVVWGVLHGSYLAVEHLAQPLLAAIPERIRSSRVTRAVAAILTFHLVCIAWVFFRAPTVSGALSMLAQMMLPNSFHPNLSPALLVYVALGAGALTVALMLPERATARVPAWAWGMSAAVMLFLTIVTWADANAFIYFRF